MAKQSSSVQKLRSIAMQAKELRSSIRVDAADGYAILTFVSHGPAEVPGIQAGYRFLYGPNFRGRTPVLTEKVGRKTRSIGQYEGEERYWWEDESLGDCLRLLVKDWARGTPDFDSIRTKTKKSPLKGVDLACVTLAAWLEAFGHDVPETEELLNRIKMTRKKHKDLRAECFDWLSNGPPGIRKWNELKVDERESVGRLGKCQLSGCDLRGGNFGNQGLRGSDFRKANLAEANLFGADCREVTFCDADLSEAWMPGAKLLNADFSNACLTNAKIRDADCRGAVFAGANLDGVDFSFADFRQVDLSSVNLERADLFRVKYDEQTRFPTGFVIDPKLRMEWKGALKRSTEYRSSCSLDELLSLIPPPPSPIHAKGDWKEAEEQLGIRFPSDFKQFISAYGSGKILSDVWIYNPLTADGRKEIAAELETLADIRESFGALWPISPEESGILPWGIDSHGNVFCWMAEGDPDAWPTGQFWFGEEEPSIDRVNITTFLFNYARNQYPELLGGQEFDESDYTFSPS